MSAPIIERTEAVKLRLDAEARLHAGSAPSTNGWSVRMNALALLHRLASSPDDAVDALKLLHELQVHQVRSNWICRMSPSSVSLLKNSLVIGGSMLTRLGPGGFCGARDVQLVDLTDHGKPGERI